LLVEARRRTNCRQRRQLAVRGGKAGGELPLTWDISMSDHLKNSIKAGDFPKRRRRVAVKRRTVLSTVIIALLAGGIAFTTALFVSKIWAASRQSPLTYQQCASLKENASRLACYDRQNSLNRAKEVRRLPSGEIPKNNLSNPDRHARAGTAVRLEVVWAAIVQERRAGGRNG